MNVVLNTGNNLKFLLKSSLQTFTCKLMLVLILLKSLQRFSLGSARKKSFEKHLLSFDRLRYLNISHVHHSHVRG